MRLNIGSGAKYLPGYLNVDMEPAAKPDKVFDIGADEWPFPQGSVDGVNASHVFEHLPWPKLAHCLKEMYRVCKPGARVDFMVPWPSHDNFISDPTHCTPIMPRLFVMLSREDMDALNAKGIVLTRFCDYLGVDFKMDPTIRFVYDQDVDPKDPELEWKAKHLRNIIIEWGSSLTVVK